MRIKFLEWDSFFFNKRIGEIELASPIHFEPDSNDFDLLYVKQKEDVVIEIDNFKQSYFETKVVFAKSVLKNNLPAEKSIVSAFNSTFRISQIYELAFESGKYSRFNLDENFQRSEFEALYRKWVDNSLTAAFADEVLLYKLGDAILGIVTYKVFGNYATIGLLATHPESQGKGIGTKLVSALEKELYERGVEALRIPTQLQNEQACGFYAKMGYAIFEKTIIKHYWRL